MIALTRLSGSVFVLNADLIERVDSTPDTVVTTVDGRKYLVQESLSEIIDATIEYRSAIANGRPLGHQPKTTANNLAPVRPLHPLETADAEKASQQAASADNPVNSRKLTSRLRSEQSAPSTFRGKR